jgi:hypothetical protein
MTLFVNLSQKNVNDNPTIDKIDELVKTLDRKAQLEKELSTLEVTIEVLSDQVYQEVKKNPSVISDTNAAIRAFVRPVDILVVNKLGEACDLRLEEHLAEDNGDYEEDVYKIRCTLTPYTKLT